MSRLSHPSSRPAKRSRHALERRRVVRRMIVLGLVLLLAFGAIVGRIATLQLRPPAKYLAFSEEQRVREIVLPATRGAIVDRNGAELALTIPQPSLYANPQLVADIPAAAAELGPLVGRLPADLEHAILDAQVKGLEFVWIARVVTPDVAKQALDLGIPGLFSVNEPKRFLTSGGNSGVAVVGRTDIDNKGLSGLEKQFDDVLQGEPGRLVVEKGSGGRTIPGGVHESKPAVPGSTLVLSIDRGLQFETERLLVETVDQLGAKGGTVLVSDPETGEILTAASVTRADGDTAKVSSNNWAATYTFEPGSITKAITMSAALETGTVTPDSKRAVPTKLVVADREFVDESGLGGTTSTVTDILKKSSNNGTIGVAQDLGPAKLYDWFRKFGLGTSTGANVPQEERGLLPSVTKWSESSLPTFAIGQGFSATPLQMLDVYNTIANDGVLVSPRFVRGVQAPGGAFQAAAAGEPRRVVSATTAQQMRTMLAAVVEDGTGKKAKVQGFSVAGKTGTAWKALNVNGKDGYVDDAGHRHYVTSFAGMLPADDPKLTILVVIDDPAVANASGGGLSAPLFSEVASYAVRNLRIAPSDASTGSAGNRVLAPAVVAADANPATTATTAPAAGPASSVPAAAGTGSTTTTAKPGTTTAKPATTTAKPGATVPPGVVTGGVTGARAAAPVAAPTTTRPGANASTASGRAGAG